jgi:hypothetical protein
VPALVAEVVLVVELAQKTLAAAAVLLVVLALELVVLVVQVL